MRTASARGATERGYGDQDVRAPRCDALILRPGRGREQGMKDGPEDSSVDVEVVEAELCRLPEVVAVRMVVDDVGRPVELHVLATPTKTPKQIARDIQSVALASFGLELDRRIISVVQLDTG